MGGCRKHQLRYQPLSRADRGAGLHGRYSRNSLGDLLCAIAGVLIARKLGWFRAVIVFLLLEVVLLIWIRDSLLLQILMLIYPVNVLKVWQMCQ